MGLKLKECQRVCILFLYAVYTGMTPGANFITMAGVSSPRSSYIVYVAPFKKAIWIGLVLSALVISVIHFAAISFSAFWTIHGSRFTSEQRVSVSTMPVAWLLVTSIINYLYQAAFSSDFCRAYHLETSYKRLLDLKNFPLYLLIDEALCEREGIDTACPKVDIVEPDLFCFGGRGSRFPQCAILRDLSNMVQDEFLKRLNNGGVSLNKEDKDRWEILTWFSSNHIFLVCNRADIIKRLVKKKAQETDLFAFVTYDYEY